MTPRKRQTKTKLEPCPRCTSTDLGHHPNGGIYFGHVFCRCCNYQGPAAYHFRLAWNRRAEKSEGE